MGRLLTMAMSATLTLTLALAGCGGSSSTSGSSSTATATSASQTTPTATGTQTSGGAPAATPPNAQTSKTEHLPKVILPVSSPVFGSASEIPVRYTCDGADTSPPVKWGAIPAGTAELGLFVLDNEAETGKTPVYWGVMGLQPTLKGVSAGKLPPGAIVGRNSFGQTRYTVCPAKSAGTRHYAVALLALPSAVAAKPGFNANALFKTVLHTAEYGGLAVFAYKRH
jgi:phosphatidylethanolamine-binding protein (PEBP) family uncharacterized protein